jgi:hypothetical protein
LAHPEEAAGLAERFLVGRDDGRVVRRGIVGDGDGAPVGVAKGLLMETNVGDVEED